MTIDQNISLNSYSTMRLGGKALYFTELHNKQDVEEAAWWAEEHQVPLLIIGGGSNVIFTDEGYHGLVAHNMLTGITIADEAKDTVTIDIQAGHDWDAVVAFAVERQLYGIECLSLVPGSAGATPVQNVGAYGQEIADTFVSLTAYDRDLHEWVEIHKDQCNFSYRKSIFNTTKKGRYIITSIRLALKRASQEKPLYRALQDYLDAHSIAKRDAQTIRDAVIAIRQNKLPDPKIVANNGSFFHNPLVATEQVAELLKDYPEMPHFPVNEQQEKLPAAWLIDQIGFKGKRAHGIYVSDKQPLVLINETASSSDDLLAMRDEIIVAVKEKFDITLHQEPELITPLETD